MMSPSAIRPVATATARCATQYMHDVSRPLPVLEQYHGSLWAVCLRL